MPAPLSGAAHPEARAVMARTEAQRERSQYRKTQQMIDQTHGGFAGKSILEKMIEQLDIATGKYLDAKASTDPLIGLKTEMIARGEIRGLARAISLMQNPYYPTRAIKSVEAESANRVRRARHAQE